jgi:hypothetical protein
MSVALCHGLWLLGCRQSVKLLNAKSSFESTLCFTHITVELQKCYVKCQAAPFQSGSVSCICCGAHTHHTPVRSLVTAHCSSAHSLSKAAGATDTQARWWSIKLQGRGACMLVGGASGDPHSWHGSEALQNSQQQQQPKGQDSQQQRRISSAACILVWSPCKSGRRN